MTEKLYKILEQLESGERKNIYGLDISKEEYLSKDSNGISFLEHLLKSNHTNYHTREILKNSIEAAYIFIKHNESLFNFELDENDIFSYIDGKRFIDHLIEKNKLTSSIIKSIKSHLNIIDLIWAYDYEWNLEYLSEELVEKLITKDSNGIYPLEKYFENEKIMYRLIQLINNPIVLIELCKKHNKYELLKYANANVLLFKINEKQTLFEDLYSKGFEITCLESLPENIEFINLLRKNDLYNFLAETRKENVLLLEIEKDKTLLDELIEKKCINKLNFSVYNQKTLEILHKNNRLDLISNIYEKFLINPTSEMCNDSTLPDESLLVFLLEKGYNPLANTSSINDIQIIKTLYKFGYYQFLAEKINETNLYIDMGNGKKLIDQLFEQDANIVFKCSFEKIETAQKLLEKNRIDLLTNGRIATLLQSANEDKNYLEYILEAIKEKKLKANALEFSFYNCSSEIVAKYYLTIAKHDMIKYIERIDEKKLLEEINGKTLLDELLDLDSSLTIEKIIPKDIKSKLKIALILKSRGLEQKDIDIPVEEKDFAISYLHSVEDSMGMGPLLSEGELLLKKANDLFTKDGKSDPSLIFALICGYRNSLIINYDSTIQELRKLVEFKEKNMDKLLYVKSEDGSFFQPITKSIHCQNTNINTLLHETGHALHYFIASQKRPENYEQIVEAARSNPENLKKVEAFANHFDTLHKAIEKSVEEKYQFFFESYFDDEKKKKINEFLGKSLIEKKALFDTLDISEKELNIILYSSFTVEEYISHQKRIFLEEYTDAIIRSEYGSYMAIADILDAIYLGELHSKTLKNENGEQIKGTSGHGIYYYSRPSQGFDEMIANFSSILKFHKPKEMLELLRDLVGDDVYNMLNDFYHNNILESKQLEESKTL